MALIEARNGTDSGVGPTRAPVLPPKLQRLGQGPLMVEFRPLSACASLRDAWSQLAAQPLQPNVFYEPDFLLSAMQHLASAQQVVVLLVWAEGQGSRQLAGLMPVLLPRLPFGPGEVRGFRNSHMSSGVPLVRAERAAEVIAAMLDTLAARSPRCSALMFPQIDLEGAFAKTLLRVTQATSRRHSLFGIRQSPSLRLNDSRSVTSVERHSPEFQRQLAEIRAALGRHGKVTLVEASEGQALRDGVELFMALEASGPEGRAGTAMMLDARTASFIRMATRMMARSHQCRTLTLMLDDRPLAAAIAYASGNRAWFVKLSHDEAFASDMPEALLADALAQRFGGLRRMTLLDASAQAGNAAVEQVLNDKLATADILVSSRSGDSPAALAVRMRERLASSAASLMRQWKGERA